MQTNRLVASTKSPQCDFTISLLNDGAYTARFKVRYYVDGIRQPLRISNSLPTIGGRASVTLPWYATDILVILENLGGDWSTIATDTYINNFNYCNKCYKVWGGVATPSWDYINC